MIVNERCVSYINSLQKGNTQYLEQLEKEAKASFVPIIRKETQQLLKTMLMLKQPKRILEVGTAVGFSAILMATCCPKDCHITTIENYQKRIPLAKKHFIESGYVEQITLLEGDAAEILKTLHGTYDFIFMDAAKGQYITFLPEIKRILEPNGVLITDNVLQEGDIIESRFAVRRRERTIHKRMREYLFALTHDDIFETSILTTGDGVTISVRKE